MSEMVYMYGFGFGGPPGRNVTVHVTYGGATGSGANVSCTNGKKTFYGVTDANGNFTFKLAKGRWTITANKSGSTSTVDADITGDCTVNVSLFAATINVTYPAGSTCTATDGTTTLATQNTSGTWSCVVPNSGTWTVSCTNGEYTAKSTVSITSNGQNSTAKLSYDQYLFKNGNQYTNITGGWVSQGYYQQSSTTGTGAGTLSVVNNILTLKEPDSSWHIAGTRDKVNLSGYSTLRFVISEVNASDAYLAARDDGRYVFPFPSIRRTCSSPGTYNIDISSANSSYYIQFYRCNVSEVLLKR